MCVFVSNTIENSFIFRCRFKSVFNKKNPSSLIMRVKDKD